MLLPPKDEFKDDAIRMEARLFLQGQATLRGGRTNRAGTTSVRGA